MTINDSRIWLKDLDEAIYNCSALEMLAGKSILITGCTGLICSALVDLIIRWNNQIDTNKINNKHKDHIIIYAAGRNEKRVIDRFAPYSREPWFIYVPYDATSEKLGVDFPCDYVIHGASNAYPASIQSEPVETMLSNVLGIKALLDYTKRVNAKRLLYISSSEVYGKKDGNEPYDVDEYGYIDVLNIRNSYSIGKRAAENLCVSYMKEYGTDVVIVRPGHIYGPTATNSDNRVSSLWPRLVALGQDIIMKSDGSQVRSYCHCLDSATAILKVLIDGDSGRAYNISNKNSIISIKEMAEIVTNIAGVKLIMDLPTEEEKKSFNPMSNSSLNSEMLESLGWSGCFNAVEGFSHTVSIFKEIQSV